MPADPLPPLAVTLHSPAIVIFIVAVDQKPAPMPAPDSHVGFCSAMASTVPPRIVMLHVPDARYPVPIAAA